MDKEFYNKYINMSEEEMIKGNIYGECRHMGKEDVYEWVYQDELKIKEQKEVIDKAIKLIKYHERYRNGADCCQFVDIVSEILDPLQSILEQDETTNNAYLKEFEDWLKEVSE